MQNGMVSANLTDLQKKKKSQGSSIKRHRLNMNPVPQPPKSISVIQSVVFIMTLASPQNLYVSLSSSMLCADWFRVAPDLPGLFWLKYNKIVLLKSSFG